MTDSQLISALRRWWWALLLGTLIATVAGYAAAATATKTYEAQLDLLVGPVNGGIDLDVSGGLARTYADLATSAPILRRALSTGGAARTVEDTREALSTSSNAITRIVTVAVRDHDPRVAAALANDIGLALRRLVNRTPPRANAALEAFAHEPELAPLSNEELDGVLRAARQVFGASQTGQISVVQAAAPPSRPSGPAVALMTMLAGLAGLCLAGFVVLAQEMRARLRDETQAAARMFGGPSSVGGGAGESGDGVAEIRLGPASAESYKVLATRARLLARREEALSVLVTDSGDGSAAATVAAGLAEAVAADGLHVILGDLNAGTTGVTDMFEVQRRPGYTNLVADPAALSDGGDNLRQALLRHGERLSVLPRGTAKPPPTDSVARLTSLVDELRERADVVILAGPALTSSSTTLAWARTVDRVCLVLDSRADDDEVRRVFVGLERLDGGFVGAVLQ